MGPKNVKLPDNSRELQNIQHIVGGTIVESQSGKIIGIGAGPKALLMVMTRPDASLGLVIIEMKKASEKIKRILG